MIWLVIIVMIVVALTIIVLPLLRTVKVQSENRSEQNIVIAQEQLLDLKKARSEGTISKSEYDLACVDLEKTLHSDLQEKINTISIEPTSAYKISGALIVLFPIVVISLYYSLGSPKLLSVKPQQRAEPSFKMTEPSESDNKVSDVSSLFDKLKQRLEINPDDGQGWKMMGLTYMHFKKYEQAVIAYKKAIILLPGDDDVSQALDRALKAQSNSSDNTDTIEKKMIAPNGQTVNVGAMVMRLRSKLEQNPDNFQGWMMLGRSYITLGKDADAVDAYQNALRLKPNDSEVKELLNSLK